MSILVGLVASIMPLSDFHVRASIAVSDIQRAVEFYEDKLGLQALQSGPSATIADGSRVYGSSGPPALNVYQSVTAGKSPATMATWYVDDIEQVVDELTAAGVEFTRYGDFEHDPAGIIARAGSGRITRTREPPCATTELGSHLTDTRPTSSPRTSQAQRDRPAPPSGADGKRRSAGRNGTEPSLWEGQITEELRTCSSMAGPLGSLLLHRDHGRS